MARTKKTGGKLSKTLEPSPSQAKVLSEVEVALAFGPLQVLWGASGFGKTTMLEELRRRRFAKAPILSTRSFLRTMGDRDPMALEEAYGEMLTAALARHETVLVDDLHLLSDVVTCNHFYPRKDYLSAPLTAVAAEAERRERTLIFGCRGGAPAPIAARCYYHGIKQLDAADYSHIARAYLPAKAADTLDFAKIHRFAPKLNGHQLRGACQELALNLELSTPLFIDYVRAHRMASNVDLAEVQAVDLRSLRGLDDVIESLEANVVLPFENDALATELRIKPKRGVLLIGPPGTGKTTVGRALAHRLKSKFFLVDGTFISGTRAFYEKIQQVVEAAKNNAPSIIFIDDSDVIFETGREHGLYRYLLTLLDGIESESAGDVCVMMTAMDVGGLPPALIRSGRIELWLETRLPDEPARIAILQDLAVELPPAVGQPDMARVATATEGLTGADLKRLVEDAKVLFAYDRARSQPTSTITEYLLAAIEPVRQNRARFAEAEIRARATASHSLEQHYAMQPPDAEEDPV